MAGSEPGDAGRPEAGQSAEHTAAPAPGAPSAPAGNAGASGLPEYPGQPGNGGLGFSPAYLQNTGAPEYLLADGTPGSTPVPGSQRRRRKVWPFTSAIGVAAVVALLVALASAGLRSEHQDARTAAQVVATAARQAGHVNSVSATMSVTIGKSGGLTATAQVSLHPLLMSMSMTETVDGISVPVSLLLAGDTMYLKFGTTSEIPAGMLGKWIKMPLSATGLGSVFSSGQGSIASENPASQAAMLAGAKDVQATGSQVVNGVRTAIYTGTLSTAAALKNLSPSERALLSPALKQVDGTIDFTAWIDSSNQVRKLAETETIAGQSVHIVFTVLAYNQPVNVTIPSSSELYNLPAGSNPIS
jgi:LppX_LprAFG lipoprotein